VLARRRLIAAILVALAVLTGIRATAAPPAPTTPVVVAGADLAGGSPVRRRDLRVVPYPADAVPTGAVARVHGLVGRVLAAPLRRGEPVTDVRLVAPGLLAGYPGTVAAPVRVADRGAVRLLEVGDRVDLIATRPDGGEASVVVGRAPVVAVPRGGRHEDGMTTGGLVVVAVSSDRALALAAASVTSVLSVTLNR
jgi:Flp pilus assembly protein CpaB